MEQLILPFGHRFAEDRASLLIAVTRAGLRRLDQAFILMVHDVTRDGVLHKSYAEIAERLHVSRATARRCVARCIEAGLVVATIDQYRTGGQRENAYSIDWDGVRCHRFNTEMENPASVGNPPPPAHPEQPPAHPEQPPAHFEHPPAHPEQPPAQTAHPYKEYIPPCIPPKNPPPPPAEGGKAGGGLVGWEDIRQRLRHHGMADAVGAIRHATLDGLDPPAVAELIDHWEARRPAWDVGGLYWRLTRGTWPEVSAAYATAQRTEELTRERQRRRQEEARRQQLADQQDAAARDLEQRVGSAIDAMPADAYEQLVDRVFGETPLRRMALRDRDGPLVRPALLEAMAQQEVSA